MFDTRTREWGRSALLAGYLLVVTALTPIVAGGSATAAPTAAETGFGAGTPLAWRQVSTGSRHTCGIAAGGSLWCWGAGREGLVAFGPEPTDQLSPVRVGRRNDWASVSAGAHHTCAVRRDGTLWCWGYNWNGRLGDGTTIDRWTPVRVGSRRDWASVSAGGVHSCALRKDKSLWCWGSNDMGGIGDGTAIDRWRPTRVKSRQPWVQVSVGYSTCARTAGNALWCWGRNDAGQVGDGTTIDRWRPTRVGLAADWVRVSAGSTHTCALRAGHGLWCWGYNLNGELGNGSTVSSSLPVRIPAGNQPAWISVAASGAHTCAIRTDHSAWCWGGTGGYGSIGNGTTDDSLVPVPIGSDTDWRTISPGLGHHTCGLRFDRSAWCWGDNMFGQVGDGTRDDRLVPVPVTG